MRTKADLHREMLANAKPEPSYDPGTKAFNDLPRDQQVAELLSRDWDKSRIANYLGYASAHGVNAQIQRIRAKLGVQAI